MSLYVEQAGQGPELVLLHGWGLSSAIWQPLRPALEARFRLTLIDLPGLGGSEPLVDTTIDTLAEAILAEAPQCALWLGWSLGGVIAAAAAARAPERVAGLVTVASNPCFVQQPDWPCAMPLDTFEAFSAGLAEEAVRTLSRFAALQAQGSRNARAELKLLRAVLGADAVATHDSLAQTLALLQQDARATLRSLGQPSLHILGERDGLVPAGLAGEFTRLQPGSRVVLYEGAAHLPFLTAPERFVADLDAFARTLEGAA